MASESQQNRDSSEKTPAATEAFPKQPDAGNQVTEKVGQTIGPYKLMEEVGEGGMGIVYVAEQRAPVKRRVALKIIKPGMDTKEVLARFGAERQALAMMNHPNIAQVLDAGTTDTGQPYFVMELVQGVTITSYCDQNKLNTRQRLNLFVDVCKAIQHAHQKGIIHRDIKPGNVMVASEDGKPVVKVIDFGVAKAINQQLTDETIYTHLSQMIGTPLYMSPEQAEMTAQDVDTRADIYSLGVLLYELLTGSPTIDRHRFRQVAYDEMRRIIREEEPTKPSSKISTLGETGSKISVDRATDPRRLSQLLRGDLDWIVMKALEKDRERRYETTNGFAMDVGRYLSGEAVVAAPPSVRYRMKKFVRRNKGPVIATSLVIATLLAGVAGTTFGFLRAESARQEAVEAQAAESRRAEGERLAKLDAEEQKQKALAAATRAITANEQSQKRLGQIEKINEILGSIFENLDPKEIAKAERPLQAILVEKLDQAVEQIEGEAIGDLLVVASMQSKLGLSLLALGEPQKSIGLLEKARTILKAKLGPDHPDAITSISNLGIAYQSAGKLELALPLLEETLKLRKAKLGPEHPSTLISMNNLASVYKSVGKLKRALPLLEETLKLMKVKLGLEHPHTLITMSNLAGAYETAGKLELALPLHEETLRRYKAKFGPKHPHTLTLMNNLGIAYQSAGKQELALPLYEETLELQKAKLGPEHPSTLISMNNLARAYLRAGKLERALPLHEETFKRYKAKFGAEHPSTLTSMNNLGIAYQSAGKLKLALPLLEETLKLRKAKLGAEHPSTLASMGNLALACERAGKLERALPLHEETLKQYKAKFGPEHPHTLAIMDNLAGAYRSAGKLDLALPLFKETLKLRKTKLGPDHPDTIGTMANLGQSYKDAGRIEEAIPLLEEAYRAAKKHPRFNGVGSVLFDLYLKVGKTDQAVALSDERLADARAGLPKESPQLGGLLARLAFSFLNNDAFAESEPLFRECLTIREKAQPDAWLTFNTQSMLGGALLGQKKYADAEPLLLSGYEGMKQREKTIPPQAVVRLTEALERLIKLYEATEKRDEAAKWRKELQLRPAALK